MAQQDARTHPLKFVLLDKMRMNIGSVRVEALFAASSERSATSDARVCVTGTDQAVLVMVKGPGGLT
jgi:hypothetical protein